MCVSDVILCLNDSKYITVNNHCLSTLDVFSHLSAMAVCACLFVSVHVSVYILVFVCICEWVARCLCVKTHWIKKELTLVLNFSKVHRQ